ncbi:PadR family transcriptional regulator [Microbispora sp. NPDC049125]|uniref:PadR family transcriptional regulator n=1 Tax=Microbispora sp. NPDC049125 TaxID=3154929 RepID=UPI003465717F
MSLRIALLGLLAASGPASGYDLTKKFETSLAYVWQAGHSQIYPELAKMAADGLVSVEAEGTRGRKTYTITPEGEAELHQWMVERDPVVPLRSESALQAFMVPLLEPDEAIAVLERMRAGSQARLAQLEALRETKTAAARLAEAEGRHPDAFGRYALDLGIRHARTAVEWASDSIADIRRRT